MDRPTALRGGGARRQPFILPRTPDGAVDIDRLRRAPAITATSEAALLGAVLELCARDMPEEGKPIAAMQAMLATLDYVAASLAMTSAQLRETIREVVRKTAHEPQAVHVLTARRGDVVFIEVDAT